MALALTKYKNNIAQEQMIIEKKTNNLSLTAAIY